MDSHKTILLVEDNPDDEVLTLRALKKNNILNEVIVARDGVEALDYLFGTGKHSGRDLRQQPQLVLEGECGEPAHDERGDEEAHHEAIAGHILAGVHGRRKHGWRAPQPGAAGRRDRCLFSGPLRRLAFPFQPVYWQPV